MLTHGQGLISTGGEPARFVTADQNTSTKVNAEAPPQVQAANARDCCPLCEHPPGPARGLRRSRGSHSHVRARGANRCCDGLRALFRRLTHLRHSFKLEHYSHNSQHIAHLAARVARTLTHTHAKCTVPFLSLPIPNPPPALQNGAQTAVGAKAQQQQRRCSSNSAAKAKAEAERHVGALLAPFWRGLLQFACLLPDWLPLLQLPQTTLAAPPRHGRVEHGHLGMVTGRGELRHANARVHRRRESGASPL